jgi:1,4-alpha-glucan branching enzyme
MIHLIGGIKHFHATAIHKVWDNDEDKILAFRRENLIFVFNFNPVKSFTGYGFLVPPGKYRIILNTDDPAFGGFGLIDDSVEHYTVYDSLYAMEKKEWLKLYLPARTAVVLRVNS